VIPVQSLVLLLLLLSTGVGTAAAQTMRPFSTFRQLHGETRLNARLEYGSGNLRLQPGDPRELYRMTLSYDQDRFLPVSDFDSPGGTVHLGLKARGEGGLRVVSRNQLSQTALVFLSPRVEMSLDLSLGAVDADLELGGLRLSEIDVQTGASQATVRFSHPNTMRCRTAVFSAGAAEMSVIGLGNSRCEEIVFDGGVGKVLLDFSGVPSTNTRAVIQMAVGGITLRLPRAAGVRITMDKFLSSFEPTGLARKAGAFVSPNYDKAGRKVDIELTTAIGGVDVEWVE
jgi:hypothetical protein